jgi:PilZ domain/SPOR domain
MIDGAVCGDAEGQLRAGRSPDQKNASEMLFGSAPDEMARRTAARHPLLFCAIAAFVLASPIHLGNSIKANFPSTTAEMIQERRQYQRLVPDIPAPIYLSQSGIVLLFDLSEGGVGVRYAAPAAEKQIFSLAFDLPGMGEPIRATAETAWTSDSGGRAGFRFVDLTDTSRQQLKNWISSKAFDSAQTPLAFPGNETKTPATVCEQGGTRDSSVSPGWQEEELAGLRAALVSGSRPRPGRLGRTVGVSLAIVVFVPTCLYLGHLLGDMGHNVPSTGITTIAQADAPAREGSDSTVKLRAAAHPDFPDALSLDQPGFVLQAGAMRHEIYADELRTSLEQKNFPAFVYRRSARRFYRVAVGPYRDAGTAERIKDKLEGLGFPTIVKRWSPELESGFPRTSSLSLKK